MREADCPYCFDGVIKKDAYQNYFCCACYKEVDVKQFNKGCKNYQIA